MNPRIFLKQLKIIPKEQAVERLATLNSTIKNLEGKVKDLEGKVKDLESSLENLYFVQARFHAYKKDNTRVIKTVSRIIEASSNFEAIGAFVRNSWPDKLEVTSSFNMSKNTLYYKKLDVINGIEATDILGGIEAVAIEIKSSEIDDNE